MKNNFLKTINDAINLKKTLIKYDKEVLETIELFFNTLKKGGTKKIQDLGATKKIVIII